ncbi:MAG: Ig-like domain-containing protein [Myxococcota bacterium]
MRTTLLALILVGCTKSGPADTDPQDTDPGCVATLASITPADGATDVPVNTTVDVVFTAPPNPNWAMGIAGVQGRVEVGEDGLSASFVPNAPLAEDTLYSVTVSVCDVTTPTTFRTTTEPVDPGEGDTYELPFDDLEWVSPSSAAVFTTLIAFDSFLMEIGPLASDGQSFDAMFTAGWPLGEPECPSAVAIQADYSGNPIFTTDSGVLDIPVEDAPIPLVIHIDELTFTGRFTAEGGLENVRFTGRIDTRPFDDLLGGPNATCELAELAGDVCAPCADGEASCLLLDVRVDEAVLSFGPGISEPCGL